MKKPTLLETAKSIVANRRTIKSSEEEIELALAWARGEISYTQAQKAFGSSRQIYPLLARALRDHHIRKNL